MKLPIAAALALAALAAAAHANDSDAGAVLVPNNHGGFNSANPSVLGATTGIVNGAVLVPNNHGGYNTANPNALAAAIPFFGAHGFAANVIAHAHDKRAFILVPGTEDQGHGVKIVVYRKVYFATQEQADAAKLKQ